MGKKKKRAAKPALRGVEARDELVMKNLRLVPFFVYRKKKFKLARIATAIGHKEARQCCHVTLVRAAELWDPEKGRVSTYFGKCIRRSLYHEWKMHKRYAFIERASDLGVDLDALPGKELTTDPADVEIRKKQAAIIGPVLRTLTPRNKDVIEMLFGLNGYERHTLLECGQKLGVTQERVRQVKLLAIGKLRDQGRMEALMPCLAWEPEIWPDHVERAEAARIKEEAEYEEKRRKERETLEHVRLHGKVTPGVTNKEKHGSHV